jgi:hypothetical protein
MPFERRTLAIFRMAEFGFFGVFVVTLMQTPRLNGELSFVGLFSSVLKLRIKATDFGFRAIFFLLFLIN